VTRCSLCAAAHSRGDATGCVHDALFKPFWRELTCLALLHVGFASVLRRFYAVVIHVVAICCRKTPWSLSGQLPTTATAAGMLLRYCVSMTHCKRK